MNQATELDEFAVVLRKSHPLSDIACVCRDHEGVTGGVVVALLVDRDETRHEAAVRRTQT